MAAPDWRTLASVDPARLLEARLQAHYATQWLARAAWAFVAAKPDDSHTNLGWEEEFGGFSTQKVQGTKIGLKLFPLSLATLEGKSNDVGRVLSLDGLKNSDVRNWFGETANSLSLDARLLDKDPPYKIPPHRIATGSPYNLSGLDDAMRMLAAWFSNADKSLNRLAEGVRQKKLEVVSARCWPHHFDHTAQIVLEAGKGAVESGRYINVGLSPGDNHYAEPYFFVSPWPYPPANKLPPLPEPGRWHITGFTGAVLPAQKILAAQGKQATTEKFLVDAVGAAFKSLR